MLVLCCEGLDLVLDFLYEVYVLGVCWHVHVHNEYRG